MIAPGFVDLQVNGMRDVDVAGAVGRDWDRLDELLAATGVTAWTPTLTSRPLEAYATPLNRIAAAMYRGPDRPQVLGAHLEGPFLGDLPGAHPPGAVIPLDLGWLAHLPPVVRIVTLGPEQENGPEAIRLLADRGIVASLGHSGADIDTARAAFDAGATMVTHLFNAMGPLHHRNPGLAGAALADPAVHAGLIVDFVHVHPAMVALAFAAKGSGRVVLVTDAVAWEADELRDLGVRVVEGAPRLPDGTIAGSALTMDQAVRNVVDVARVTPDDAIRAASTTPARVVGATDRGRLEVGARADIVVLGADDLTVRRTVVGGRTVWED